jgi:putative ABC transport system permease protein
MMIDLAVKMLLDEKVRFAATVFGVGFAAALILIQVGLFFGLLENASITIERLNADLWVTARNAPNVDFGNPFSETYVQRVRSIPGVARADNLIVWYAIVALPTGAKESVIYYGLKDFSAWHFPWNIESGDPADLRRGHYVMLDASAERRFGPFRAGDYREFQGRRLKIIGRTREALSFTTSPVAFLDYRLAQSLSPDELRGRTTFVIVRLEPGADAAAVKREIRRRLPYNDVYGQDEWAARSRGYWIESTGLGLTLFLTVTLGALVGVVIVAQTLYSSTSEHLVDFGTVKSLGGGNLTVYAIVAEQALYASALGYGLALALAYGLAPVLHRFDMKMIVSPTLAGLVFVGTQALCVAAASLSFHKVASLDPAIVFRG